MKYIRLLQAVLLKIRMLLGTNKAYIDLMRKKGAIIGSDCEIYKSVNFGSEPYLITIGNHVRINSGVQLVTHDGGIWVLRSPKAGYGNQFINADKFGRIVIHDNVHIGTNAVIMPGVEIGENVIIGCGAIVTNSVQPNEIMFKIARSLNTPIIIKLLKIPKVNISISYIAYLTYFLYLIIVRIHIIKFETIVTIGNPIKKDHFLNPNIKSIKNNNINIWTVCKATLDARLIPFFKENIIVFHV